MYITSCLQCHSKNYGKEQSKKMNEVSNPKKTLKEKCKEIGAIPLSQFEKELTVNQIKDLYSYLSSTSIGKTRWWYILRKWNEDNENPMQILPLDTPLPNYLELIE